MLRIDSQRQPNALHCRLMQPDALHRCRASCPCGELCTSGGHDTPGRQDTPGRPPHTWHAPIISAALWRPNGTCSTCSCKCASASVTVATPVMPCSVWALSCIAHTRCGHCCGPRTIATSTLRLRHCRLPSLARRVAPGFEAAEYLPHRSFPRQNRRLRTGTVNPLQRNAVKLAVATQHSPGCCDIVLVAYRSRCNLGQQRLLAPYVATSCDAPSCVAPLCTADLHRCACGAAAAVALVRCGCAHTDRCTQAKDLGTADFAETMLGTP